MRAGMPIPPQETLFAHTAPIGRVSSDLAIDEVRFGFQKLFDQALHDVQCLGYDLDNVVFERMLDCRVDGREVCVPARFLSTRELLAASIRDGIAGELGRLVAPQAIDVAALRVVAIRHKVF